MDITVPDDIQYSFEVKRENEKQPMIFEVCFTHAVRAACMGFMVKTRLTDYYASCNICNRIPALKDDDQWQAVVTKVK